MKKYIILLFTCLMFIGCADWQPRTNNMYYDPLYYGYAYNTSINWNRGLVRGYYCPPAVRNKRPRIKQRPPVRRPKVTSTRRTQSTKRSTSRNSPRKRR